MVSRRIDETDPHAAAWQHLQRLMMGQRGRLHAIASEFDLAPAQLHALASLDPDEPRPMGGLAETLRCDNSNVTGIIDRLESRGLVRRRPDERDRRVKMLEVTREGAALREQIRRRMSAPPEPLASLSDEDAAALAAILGRAVSPNDT